jgi:hypothetical protein
LKRKENKNMDRIIQEQAVSEESYTEYEDVLDVVFAGNKEAMLDELIKGMSDDELSEAL